MNCFQYLIEQSLDCIESKLKKRGKDSKLLYKIRNRRIRRMLSQDIPACTIFRDEIKSKHILYKIAEALLSNLSEDHPDYVDFSSIATIDDKVKITDTTKPFYRIDSIYNRLAGNITGTIVTDNNTYYVEAEYEEFDGVNMVDVHIPFKVGKSDLVWVKIIDNFLGARYPAFFDNDDYRDSFLRSMRKADVMKASGIYLAVDLDFWCNLPMYLIAYKLKWPSLIGEDGCLRIGQMRIHVNEFEEWANQYLEDEDIDSFIHYLATDIKSVSKGVQSKFKKTYDSKFEKTYHICIEDKEFTVQYKQEGSGEVKHSLDFRVDGGLILSTSHRKLSSIYIRTIIKLNNYFDVSVKKILYRKMEYLTNIKENKNDQCAD